MDRKSGILLHISSLPSPYGIGTLGREAYAFADFLRAAGQRYWQLLPLGPTSYGDSPYQSFSTFAGNPYLIDLDLLAEDGLLDRALEISSMGIRVDEESLDRQLTLAGCEDRRELPFHKMLLDGQLPLTMGGGIGQSRLCMLMIGCCHIGEVQVSLWDRQTQDACAKAGVALL